MKIKPENILWTKPKLPRGDLQLLKSCNASGVLRLTQAGQQIDWKTYFRNTVFGGLAWKAESNKEVAHANFKVILNDVDHGVHNLKISHKPSWESNQGNYTTALHWGGLDAIKDWKLFHKTLTISKPTDKSCDFVINIGEKA